MIGKLLAPSRSKKVRIGMTDSFMGSLSFMISVKFLAMRTLA